MHRLKPLHTAGQVLDFDINDISDSQFYLLKVTERLGETTVSLADLPSLNYCQATIGTQKMLPKTFLGQSLEPNFTPFKPIDCQEATTTEFTTLTPTPT